MANYLIDFDYSIREGGSIELPATNVEDAKVAALEYIRETYEDVFDINIVEVREII